MQHCFKKMHTLKQIFDIRKTNSFSFNKQQLQENTKTLKKENTRLFSFEV